MELSWWLILVFAFVFFTVRTLSTPLHELFHMIAGKMLGGKIGKIVWLSFSKWKIDGEVHIYLRREKHRWLVDIAGGLGAALVWFSIGIPLIICFIKTNLFFVIAGAAFVPTAITEFWAGRDEYLRRKRRIRKAPEVATKDGKFFS